MVKPTDLADPIARISFPTSMTEVKHTVPVTVVVISLKNFIITVFFLQRWVCTLLYRYSLRGGGGGYLPPPLFSTLLAVAWRSNNVWVNLQYLPQAVGTPPS